MKVTSLLLLSSLAVLSSNPVSGTSCPTASTAGDSCSTNIFGGKGSIETVCSADYDSVSVSGSVIVNTKFDESLEVTAVPCLLGFMWCYRQYAQNLGKFCGLATHQKGAACGSSGTYSVNAGTFDIVEDAKKYMGGNYLLGTADLKLYLGFSEDCEAKRTTNSVSSWLGFSMVPVAGLATIVARSRRRRPILNIDGGSDTFVGMESVL
jgi:hypothetical protein